MKRKFSFNLPTLKVPPRGDSLPKRAPEPAPSHVSSHKTHRSKDSVSSVNTSLISRRPLDQNTEQELRAACALVLQNFKPSDHGLVDTDPKLDFNGPHTRRREQQTEASQVKVRKPTGAPAAADIKAMYDARKQSHKPETSAVKGHPDTPAKANTGRRRAEQMADKEAETRGRVISPKLPTTVRHDIDSDDAKSLSTPLTASTDIHINNGSTAPTSVAVNSGISSKRASHHYESAASIADAQAADWMRLELEKRRAQMASQPASEQPQTSHRPPSRANSIKAGIKEYMFPGSSSVTRSQSRDSLSATNSLSSNQLGRSGSTRGWRSWGLPRKSSSRSSSRPGTSDGRIERPEKENKAEVNLNRELPPLPSLDTWQSEQLKSERRKSQTQGAHIATLMRPQDQQQQEYAAAVRKHHRRSGSDSLAVRHADARSPSQKSSAQMPPKLAPQALDTSMDFDQMMSAMSSTRDLNEHLKPRVKGHVSQQSDSSVTHTYSTKVSMDGRLNAPNFSRKISTDVPPPQRALAQENAGYENTVQISGHGRKEEQKSRLRKVFSGWMLKKEKKEDWMGRIEKGGVKGGIMTQDQAALPPVVRY